MSNVFVPQRELSWQANLGDSVAEVSWSADGKFLAAGGVDGRLGLFDPASGQVLRTFAAHEGGLFRCLFSPAGSVFATAGQDGRAKLWSGETGELLKELPTGAAWVEQLTWSPTGDWLAVAAGKRLRLWNPASGIIHESTEHRSTISGLAWHRDGALVAASCYGGVEIWDAASGSHRESLPWKTSLVSVAWSPDGRWVVAGTQELSVQIWELPYKPGEELAMSGYAAKVRELAWHFSGRQLATGGGTDIMVWDCSGAGPAGTAPRVLTGHQGKVSVLAYQPAAHFLASGGADARVLLWNARRSETPLRQFKLAAPITTLRWSAEGSRFVVGSRDGTLGVGAAPA